MPPRKLIVLLLVCNVISIAIAYVFTRLTRPSPGNGLNKADAAVVDLAKPDHASEAKTAIAKQVLPEIAFNKPEPIVIPPDIALRQPSFSPPPSDKAHVWMVGYAVRGGTINVWLSDGRFLTERDPELGPLYRNSVEIERHRVWMMPPTRPGALNAVETLQGPGAKGAPVSQDAGAPSVANGG